MNFLTIIPLMTAFVITGLLTVVVKQVAKKFELVDDPKHRAHPAQVHVGTIPRAGGVGILFGIVIPALIFIPLQKEVIGILLGALLTVVVGVIDDWLDLSPYIRFITNIISAVIVILSGVVISYINNPLGGVIHLNTFNTTINLFGETYPLIGVVVTVLFIVWTMNIVGWSSGVDGQLPGFVVIASFVLGILSLRFVRDDPSQLTVTTLCFITLGAYLGFLPWNFYPQKIMPGYGGKSLAGFMLAALSILSGAKVGTMVLVLGLPMTDALYVVVRRLLSGRSPVWPDRKHLHHALLSTGWSKPMIAIFYWLVAALLGMVALFVSSETKLFTLLMVVATVGGILFWRQKMGEEIQSFTQTSGHKSRKSNPLSH